MKAMVFESIVLLFEKEVAQPKPQRVVLIKFTLAVLTPPILNAPRALRRC